MSGPLTLAVPVFNGERFLGETLASLNANGSQLRWWLQDGGSKDRTLEIAAPFARDGDSVTSESDQGQTDALNRAFSRMGGDVVGFINGDDLLLPDTARRVLEFFDDHPEIDLVYGEIEWIDEHGTVTGRHEGRINSLEEALDLYGVWWKERQWVQPEVFFRRSLWERAGPFNTRYELAFDYDFWIRCFRVGARVARLPHVLSRFRLHAAQKSVAAERAADDMRDILRTHLDSHPSITVAARWRIAAELNYDLYQSGKSNDPSRSSFFSALLRHPDWLLAPPVRNRLWAALHRRTRGKLVARRQGDLPSPK